MAVPGDGAIPIANPFPAPVSGRGAAIIKEFFDANGNSVPNPNPTWGGFFEFKPGKELDDAVNGAGAKFTGNFSKTVDATVGKLDAASDVVKQKSLQDLAQASTEVTQIIQAGERRIATNAKPIIGALDAVTSGAKGIAALDDATLVAVSTSIPWALEFLQTERIGQTNKAISSLTSAALAQPSLIVKGVSDSLSQLGRGLIDAFAAMMQKIEGLILDPLAILLAAILAAIRQVPQAAAEAVWDNLLKDDGSVKV